MAPDIAAVAPVVSSSETLTAGSSNWTTTVVGTNPSWLTVRDRTVTEGRFIDHQDVADHTAVAVLGSDTAVRAVLRRGPGRPDGQRERRPHDGDRGAQHGRAPRRQRPANQDDQVVVPISTAIQRLFGTTSLSSILVQSTSAGTLSAAYQEADTELLALHDITTPADADFTIASQQSLVSTATSVDQTLTILLGGIAGISLLVGGIGVMNIMLVSVTERIREIGLRKALGATPRLIRRQFLVEASALGLTGGALGALLGVLGAGLSSRTPSATRSPSRPRRPPARWSWPSSSGWSSGSTRPAGPPGWRRSTLSGASDEPVRREGEPQ